MIGKVYDRKEWKREFIILYLKNNKYNIYQ